MPLQIRRGTDAERQLLAVPLADGELLWTTDLKQLFVGDGVTLAQNASPVVGYTDENAQDAASALFTHSNHTGLTFTYDDDTGQVLGSFSINGKSIDDLSDIDIAGVSNGDLLIYNSSSGNFEVGSSINVNVSGDLTGSVFANDSTVIVDAIDGSVNLDGTVKGNIIPDANEAHDIGSNSLRFRDLYLSGSSLFLGDAQITASGSAVNLPAGSTINGEPLGEITQPGNSLQVNILGEDSSSIIDIATNTIQGNFIGSVFTDSSTTVIDGATGEIFGDITTDNITSLDVDGLRVTTAKGAYFSTVNELAARITSLNNGGSIPRTSLHVISGTLDNPSTITPGDFGAQLSFTTFFDVAGNDAGKSLVDIITQMDSGATVSDDAPASRLAFSISAGDGAGDVDSNYNQFIMQPTGAFDTKIVTFVGQDAAKKSAITPAAGMVIFNSDTQKYQGYVDDTGLAGGGASNSTPGWIDLH